MKIKYYLVPGWVQCGECGYQLQNESVPRGQHSVNAKCMMTGCKNYEKIINIPFQEAWADEIESATMHFPNDQYLNWRLNESKGGK